MRRLITAAILVAATLLVATPAHAFGHHWGRCGWGGYRGFGGYGYGWGGYGYRGYGWGYPGYGYGFGYRGIGYGYPGFGYGGYGYGYPGFGYGGYGGYGLGGFGGFGYSGYASPYYATSYSPSYYSSYSPLYGCANYCGSGYGTTVSRGYPASTLYGASYAPSANIIVSSVPKTSPATVTKRSVAMPRLASPPVMTTAAPAGASALQKFLGLRDIRPVALTSATPAVAKPTTSVAKTLGDVLARVSNVESRRKADRMITEGDELFRAQNFHSALQKYKLAASTAPDLAEALWREGHALVATHNYDLATTVFKRAIALTEDLGRGGFRLSDLYAGATMTKTHHLESLAEWAISRSNSSDPYFLLGLFLNYDGQPARAEKFFQKASDLAGISGGHIAVFLAPAEEAPRLRIEGTAGRPAAVTPVVPISVGTEL